MVTTAASVEWTVVKTEVEALQLEYSWIKEFDPRFNVKYRDDKSYPWLAVTVGDEFPRVMVGRGAKRKGTRYFGPYSHAWAIRETVDILLRVFPMRSCSNGVFKRSGQIGRPCLLGYIDKCAAPCVGNVSAEEHRAIVDDFCDFMAGQTTPVHQAHREARCTPPPTRQDFEKAARLRDDLGAMQQGAREAGGGARRRRRRRRDRAGRGPARGRRPDLLRARRPDPRPARLGGRPGRRGRHRRAGRGLPAPALRRRRGRRRSRARSWCPTLPPDAPTFEQLLGDLRGSQGPDPGAAARRQEDAAGDRRAATPKQSLALHKTKRASDLTTRNRALEEIQEALELDEAPLRIECYDVSNLQGTEVVASMVVFEDGLARKGEYRRFVIRGVDGQNDVASMHEVITRRFRRLLDEQAGAPRRLVPGPGAGGADGPMLVDPETGRPRKFAYAPGLVVVDGGPPQVAAAQQALDELGIDDIPVCGLAKRLEEVWLPAQEDPVILPRSSEGLYLLQRIRDEAHRFAITHHRGRRSKTMVESVLDDVPGLGEVRRKTLLKHFGSLKKLREADVDEIALVPGIGPRTAAAIKDAVATAATTGKTAPVVNTATGEIEEGQSERRCRRLPPGGRARGRHRHDRRRAQHRGQGAGGPRLLRRRQPAAEPAARRRPAGRREPGRRAADRGRRRRPLRLVLRRRSQANLAQGATGRHTTLVFLDATDDVLVRRQEAARRPHPLQGGGRLLDGLQPRARRAGRPARRRRPGHRHHRPQRAPAHRPDRRGVRHPARRPG